MKRFFSGLLYCCVFASFLAGCSRNVVRSESAEQLLPAGIIECHILIDPSSDPSPEVGKRFAEIAKDFQVRGDEATPVGYRWLKVSAMVGPITANRLVLANWQNDKYVLASTAPESCLDARTKWRILDFTYEQTKPNGAMVVLKLDGSGSKQMAHLTRANISRKIGMSIFDEVCNIATIMSEVGESIAITGHPDHLKPLYEKLKEMSVSPRNVSKE